MKDCEVGSGLLVINFDFVTGSQEIKINIFVESSLFHSFILLLLFTHFHRA